MELGPRDRLCQAFWHEQKKGRTIVTDYGDVVHLDLRHLGEAKIDERLPMVRELAQSYIGVDPVNTPIPVRPVVHYTMGGIDTDSNSATTVDGLFAAGECACVSINGANRLGSNSLTELLVFGALAGKGAAEFIRNGYVSDSESSINSAAGAAEDRVLSLFRRTDGTESIPGLRHDMNDAMEAGAGIYRSEDSLATCMERMQEIRERYRNIVLTDKSNVFNTDLIEALELGSMIEVACAIACSAAERRESRGSHQRLDYPDRDDMRYLRHTIANWSPTNLPSIEYRDVTITRSKPAERVYGGDTA
jgi:fumarate reductase flavoprotein subunit